LDECYRVLREVVVHKNLPKSFELLQELRDISSMAMEHFEEHIVPTLKKNVALSSGVRSGRFLRCLPDPEDSDSEMQASSSVTACTYQSVTTPLQRLALSRSMTERPASSNLKLEFTVQQNRILINNQQRKIVDLTSKVLLPSDKSSLLVN
jgi:F-box protein 28